MKEITRKQFMGGMTATVALSWRGAFAAPARMQRGYADTTWWDPYVENITDTDTYLRRKFRHDITDKTTGVGVEALKKILAEIVAPFHSTTAPMPPQCSKAKNLHIDEKRRGVVKYTPFYAKSK